MELVEACDLKAVRNAKGFEVSGYDSPMGKLQSSRLVSLAIMASPYPMGKVWARFFIVMDNLGCYLTSRCGLPRLLKRV